MPDSTMAIIRTLLTIAWIVLGAITAAHAIMYKRDPKGAAMWVVVSFSLPLIGPWLYWGFGINRVQRKASKRAAGKIRPSESRRHDKDADRAQIDAAVENLPSLKATADRVTRMPLVAGNKLEPLHNGEQAYPAMLDAIRSAEHSVTLASYIFDWDDTGREFCRALKDAAQRDVTVHLLVDGIGAVYSYSPAGRYLLKSGVELAAFFPLSFPFGRVRLNLRNHRKLLIIDGKVGFTGGMNISSKHLLNTGSPRRIEDLHFRLTGPIVDEMQHAFADDWNFTTGEVLEGRRYFPSLPDTGKACCRGIASGPDEDLERVHLIMRGALAAARHKVRIVTPYFVPSQALIGGMVMAGLRGVDVALILPSKVDIPFMRWAADAHLWQVLKAGVRVFHRPPPFVHTKLMIIDDTWLLIGSANVDNRSFRLNFEFNVEAYDAGLAAELSGWLDDLMSGSKEVTLDVVDRRPGWQRFRDGFAHLFSPYL